MKLANAIRPKMNRHSTTNTTVLFVGVGRFSGKRAVGSMGDVLTVARNVLNRDAFVVTNSAGQKLAYVYFEDEPGRPISG
jgi:hypothetical protein